MWYTCTLDHTCARGYTYIYILCRGHILIRDASTRFLRNVSQINSSTQTLCSLSSAQCPQLAQGYAQTWQRNRFFPRQNLDRPSKEPTCQHDSTTSVQDHRDPLRWSSHNQIYLPGLATNAERLKMAVAVLGALQSSRQIGQRSSDTILLQKPVARYPI